MNYRLGIYSKMQWKDQSGPMRSDPKFWTQVRRTLVQACMVSRPGREVVLLIPARVPG